MRKNRIKKRRQWEIGKGNLEYRERIRRGQMVPMKYCVSDAPTTLIKYTDTRKRKSTTKFDHAFKKEFNFHSHFFAIATTLTGFKKY